MTKGHELATHLAKAAHAIRTQRATAREHAATLAKARAEKIRNDNPVIPTDRASSR